MAKYQNQNLDETFAALSDPHRRAILSQLERTDGLSISALAEPLDIKLPTVMKHLNVLSEAGLIRRTKHGRTVTVEITPKPLRDAVSWLNRYERFWSASLDRLVEYAEKKEATTRRRRK